MKFKNRRTDITTITAMNVSIGLFFVRFDVPMTVVAML